MDIQWLLQLPQQTKESGKSLTTSLALRAGDRLTASVLDVEKGSDALLAIGQFKAYARLPLPVVTGQDIQIAVEAEGEDLRMVMVPPNRQTTYLQSGDPLEIRLFEPISGRPWLSDYSRLLVPGEALQGRITGFEKDGLMLVDFGKFKAFAKIDIPVRPGQTIPLTVIKNDNAIAFAVDPNVHERSPINMPADTTVDEMPANQMGKTQYTSAASPAQHAPHAVRSERQAKSGPVRSGPTSSPTASDMDELRKQIQLMLDRTAQAGKAASISLPAPVKGALINLQQALCPAALTGDIHALVARVRDFVENSGVYFEKRLGQAITDLQFRSASMTSVDLARQPSIRNLMTNDMKPNLLILNQFLDRQLSDSPGAERHLLETLKSLVQRAVSHIERQQWTATEKPVDPDLFQAFSHLMFLTDTHRNARFKVYYAKKGRDDAHRNPRVSLLLDMDRMGTVRTDLWMVGTDLNITFFVQDIGAKEAVEKDRHRIGKMLKDTFNTVAVSVVVNEKKIVEFEGEDLSLPNSRQVDLSI